MNKSCAVALIVLVSISTFLFANGGQESTVDPESFNGTVEIIVPTGGFYIDPLNDHLVPLVAERFPNIEILVSTEGDAGGSGTQTLNARLAAGDLPDLYIGPRGAVAATYARNNQLVVLNTLEGYQEIEERIMPNLMDRSLGDLFYFPYEAITTLMLYNREIFEEAGLDADRPPATWDEFMDYAAAIDALPMRDYGAKVYATTTWTEALNWGGWYWNMLAPIFANFNDGQPELFNEYGTDIVFDRTDRNLVEFFTFLRDMQVYAPDSMEEKFWQREIGMWPQFGVGWRANLAQGRDRPMVLGEDVAVAPLPVLEPGMTSWTMHGGRGLVMFKTDETQQKLAWEVMKLMFDPEFYLEYCKALSVLPVMPETASDPFFQGPEIKPFVDALDHIVEEESFPAWDEVANIMLATIAKVMLTGELTPEKAVEYAATEARNVLANY